MEVLEQARILGKTLRESEEFTKYYEAEAAFKENSSPYTEAMLICMDAAVKYVARYEDLARKLIDKTREV
ncbi:MAG: hypothetical protein IKL42_00545, partial [Clostridia bacterium]|nr:hypothetical protein [Clostridia bacterium]